MALPAARCAGLTRSATRAHPFCGIVLIQSQENLRLSSCIPRTSLLWNSPRPCTPICPTNANILPKRALYHKCGVYCGQLYSLDAGQLAAFKGIMIYGLLCITHAWINDLWSKEGYFVRQNNYFVGRLQEKRVYKVLTGRSPSGISPFHDFALLPCPTRQ